MNKVYPRLEKRKAKKRLAKWGVSELTSTDKTLIHAVLENNNYFNPALIITDGAIVRSHNDINSNYTLERNVPVSLGRSIASIVKEPIVQDTNPIVLTYKDLNLLGKAYLKGTLAKTFATLVEQKTSATMQTTLTH